MNFGSAIAYQDSLDAVASGTFTSVQATEVDAIVAGIEQYLAVLSAKVSGYKTLVANAGVLDGKVAAAVQVAIDGPGPLPSPRIQIYGGVVMTAAEIAAKQAADAAAAQAAQAGG